MIDDSFSFSVFPFSFFSSPPLSSYFFPTNQFDRVILFLFKKIYLLASPGFLGRKIGWPWQI
jgi:hypothetical protein